jgi:agmatine deiminase
MGVGRTREVEQMKGNPNLQTLSKVVMVVVVISVWGGVCLLWPWGQPWGGPWWGPQLQREVTVRSDRVQATGSTRSDGDRGVRFEPAAGDSDPTAGDFGPAYADSDPTAGDFGPAYGDPNGVSGDDGAAPSDEDTDDACAGVDAAELRAIRSAQRFRRARPGLYRYTAAPMPPLRLIGEPERVSLLGVAWEPGPDDDFFVSLSRLVWHNSSVDILYFHNGAVERAEICEALDSAGLTGDRAIFLDVAKMGPCWTLGNPSPDKATPNDAHKDKKANQSIASIEQRCLESDWIRDWGPFFIERWRHRASDGQRELAIVDSVYERDRPNDDALPSKLARLMGFRVYRPQLEVVGGNLISDGLGTCYTAWDDAVDLSTAEVGQLTRNLQDFLGCRKTIILKALEREPTGHVDMFLKIVSPTTVLLGQYTVRDDPVNHAVLAQNRAILAGQTNARGQRINVLRVPMPNNKDGRFRTYLNAIVVNRAVIVPTYHDDRRYEAQAVRVYRRAFPARRVLGLQADDTIPRGGAIRCLTKPFPALEPEVLARLLGAKGVVAGCAPRAR